MLHCAQPLLATLYSSHLLHSQSYPSVSAPRCNPFGCSCSPPCNPPRRRLLLFPFFQFGLGGGKRATPSPLFSLHPPSTVPYHPRGFLCLCRFLLFACVAPPLLYVSRSLRLCLSPRWLAKGKISIFICFFAGYMPAPSNPRLHLASPLLSLFRRFLFLSFATPPPPCEFLGLSHPFLGLLVTFPSLHPFLRPPSRSRAFFLPFWWPSPYLRPTTLLRYGALWR